MQIFGMGSSVYFLRRISGSSGKAADPGLHFKGNKCTVAYTIARRPAPETPHMDNNFAVPTSEPEGEAIKLGLVNAVDSLAELYELLEDYGPIWYSEAVHDRALSTLVLLRASLRLEPPRLNTTLGGGLKEGR
jgi:hypothetical protein